MTSEKEHESQSADNERTALFRLAGVNIGALRRVKGSGPDRSVGRRMYLCSIGLNLVDRFSI
jgi:hypothetical protein